MAKCRNWQTVLEALTIAIFRVVRRHFAVGGEQRRQISVKGQIDRRAVVERADGHGQQVGGGAGAGIDHQIQVVVAAAELAQRFDAAAPQRHKAAQDGGGEQLAAFMRLFVTCRLQQAGIRFDLCRAAQAVGAHAFIIQAGAKLLAKPEQHGIQDGLGADLRRRNQADAVLQFGWFATGQRQFNGFRQREDRQQGDYIGETFVEGSLVRRRWGGETIAYAVQQRMRGFVRNDVVRQAGEDALVGPGRVEISSSE